MLRAVTDDDWVLERDLSRCPDIPPWTLYPADLDEEQAKERVSRAQRWAEGRQGARYTISDATDEVLGTAGIGLADGIPEVFYALLPAARGRGAATEAVRVLTAWAHGLGYRRVRLLTLPGNDASESVARRAGFHRAGVETGEQQGMPVEFRIWVHRAGGG